LIHNREASTLLPTDDWPFLYVSGIPDLTVRAMIILGILGLAMVYFFMPKGRLLPNSRMFFLGAAFMLPREHWLRPPPQKNSSTLTHLPEAAALFPSICAYSDLCFNLEWL
jgi:hypothetical protein